VGQNYLTALGQASPLIKFGTDLISQKLTSSVRAGDRALFGGLSEKNWRSMADEFMSIDRAKANLYHVNVTNLQTKRTFTGVVVGRGQVSVTPQTVVETASAIAAAPVALAANDHLPVSRKAE